MDSAQANAPATTAKIRPRTKSGSVPLTPMQFYLWKWVGESGKPVQRTVWTCWRITGSLKKSWLKESLDALLHRHEALRTRFVVRGERVEQEFPDDYSYVFDAFDLSQLHEAERDQELRRLCESALRQNVDPTIGPPLAVHLFELSENESILLVSLDHFMSDRVSTIILHRELWTLYQQKAAGRTAQLRELQIDFGDYAVWLDQTLSSNRGVREAYWREHLRGTPHFDLPQDAEECANENLSYISFSFPFAEELITGLKRLAQQTRTQLALVVLAIYAVTIARWCKQNDLLIEFLSHARFTADAKDIVGFIATPLRLRIAVDNACNVKNFVRAVYFELCSAYEHRDFGWSYTGLPEVKPVVGFHWVDADDLTHSGRIEIHCDRGLDIEPFELVRPWREPLTITFHASRDRVVLRVSCQPEVFFPASVKRLASAFFACANNFSTMPHAYIADV